MPLSPGAAAPQTVRDAVAVHNPPRRQNRPLGAHSGIPAQLSLPLMRSRQPHKPLSPIEAVEAAADKLWLAAALQAVRRCAVTREEFISDDVWGFVDSTREDRALGPVLLRAKRLGWIVRTDRLRPSRRSNGSGKPVWRSLVWRQAQ